MQYSQKVDHFANPRNVAKSRTQTQSVRLATKMRRYNEIYMKIEDDIIKDIKFKTFGCGRRLPQQHSNRACKGKK